MRIHRRVDSSCFDEDQIKILSDAFEEALFLAQITDRTGPQAEAIAQRVIEAAKEIQSIFVAKLPPISIGGARWAFELDEGWRSLAMTCGDDLSAYAPRSVPPNFNR